MIVEEHTLPYVIVSDEIFPSKPKKVNLQPQIVKMYKCTFLPQGAKFLASVETGNSVMACVCFHHADW